MKDWLFVTALFLVGCSHATGMDQKDSSEDKFYAQQDKLFKAHKDQLVQSGHMTPDFQMVELYLGVYDWHTGSSGYFGAYSFSQAAYDQAAKGWYGHFEVIEGSNELWPQDDWDNEHQRHYVRFDNSVIGRTIPGMAMFWMDKNGKYQDKFFTAKVVGIKDDGHTLILDKHAPHHAEQWQMAILPEGYVDMCHCTNNAPTEHTAQSLAIAALSN